MRVIEFTDEYDLAAPLYGLSEQELRQQDLEGAGSTDRWLALEGDSAVGAAAGFLRPDDRMFLRCVCSDPRAYLPMIDAAADVFGRPVHVTVDADAEAAPALRAGGLEEEYTAQEFRIRFDRVLSRLRRARLPAGYVIHQADIVDLDRLFALDCGLRDLTPGTDGWRGDRGWFDDEMAESPPFDPSGYLVATARSRVMAGLVRIWRNPDEPSLGLIGVLPEYRSTGIAAELLRRGLTAASQWGSDTFRATTSPVNQVIWPRMERLGAEPLRRTIRFVYR